MTAEASPFPRRPLPIWGESVHGFERRFSSCTRYRRLDAFRHATGLRYFGPFSSNAKWQRLAEIAGVPAASVEHMRWLMPGTEVRKGVVSLLGHEVRAVHLSHIHLPFCPHCLAEDRGPERRVLRQAWHLRLVSACPRHGTLLVDRCDACAEGFDHNRKTEAWSCICGREMTEVGTVGAPEGAIAMSLAFMRHLGIVAATGRPLLDRRGVLPTPFASLPLDDLLSLSAKIGLLASTPAATDEPVDKVTRHYKRAILDPELGIATAAEMMDAAYRVMSDWPRNAGALFASLADRNPSPPIDHPVRAMFATRMGYRLLGTLRTIDGAEVGLLDEALEVWLLRERGIYLDGRRRVKVGDARGIGIDVADALRRLEGRSVNPCGISSWVDAGAVEILGSKVALASVERTVDAIARLECQDLVDATPVEEWSTVKKFHAHYRRADALRDILSGAIRVQRDPAREGLAGLRISLGDLGSRYELSRKAKCAPRKPGLSASEYRARMLSERIAKVRSGDIHLQPGKLNSLLKSIWPGLSSLDVALEPEIRCRYLVRHYPRRAYPMRLYSAVDAIDLVARTRGFDPP